jgi:hypothetical protein
MQGQQHGANMRMGDSPAVGPAWSELNSSMARMHLAMKRAKPTGNSDSILSD